MAAYSPEKWWNEAHTAVVTGANKGIGLQIAKELARAGITVVVTARNEEAGEKARDEVEAAANEAGNPDALLTYPPRGLQTAPSVQC